MTENKDEKYAIDRRDRCFLAVEEASKERQKMIDKEPYS